MITYTRAYALPMPLKNYYKATNYPADGDPYAGLQELKPANKKFTLREEEFKAYSERNFTLVGMVSGGYELLKDLVATSSGAGLIIPGLFLLTGLGFVLFQFVPGLVSDLRAEFNYYEKGTTPIVSLGYIESKEQYVSNPGADYFKRLTDSAKGQGGFYQDQESLNFSGKMYLSIPRLGINRIPVSANVDSGSSDIYNSILNTALAHFKGSSVPVSSTPGNTVIYGHSVGGTYVPRADDVVSAFTFLADMQVGDQIKLEINGKEFAYRMQRSKIVKPEDTSILLGSGNREMLTLFTCWGLGANGGPGNRSGRLVVTAMPV